MVACAVSTYQTNGISGRIVLGAVSFMVSDVFVAWDVFAKSEKLRLEDMPRRKQRKGWQSRGIGWVLYFAAQMIVAGTACHVL